MTLAIICSFLFAVALVASLYWLTGLLLAISEEDMSEAERELDLRMRQRQ